MLKRWIIQTLEKALAQMPMVALLLGSVSMKLLRQTSESLAGRIRYLKMSGLNLFELNDPLAQQQKLWLRGGFPESYLADDNEAAMEWLEDLIRTYLECDIPQAGFRVPAVRLRRFKSDKQLWLCGSFPRSFLADNGVNQRGQVLPCVRSQDLTPHIRVPI